MHFSSYHPIINLLYFASVMLLAALIEHPIFIAIAYLASFVYSVKLRGISGLLLDISLFAAAILYGAWYAYYNHFGVTVLSVNFIGNSITLEALLCGLARGFRAAAVLMLCSCLNSVMSTDKLVYLFGRVLPKLSLFIAITLRLVPRIIARAKKITLAQSSIGRGLKTGNILKNCANWVRVCSVTITWTLENMVETASSMQCRGYALPHRTAYALYRFDNRDRSFIVALTSMLFVVCAGLALGQAHMLYAPELIINRITLTSVFFYAAYAVLLLLPMALQIIGEKRFAALRSGI